MAETRTTEKFILSRSFAAPVDVIFEMWSDSKHLAKWVPPAGFDMEYIRADIREGGSAFYRMIGDGGKIEMFGRAEYIKISKPNRLVYKQQFADVKENVIRNPMSATWPETLLTTIDLTAEGQDRTQVTITWEPYGTCTDEEFDTFSKSQGGMKQGWTGTLDKLEDYLRK
jgi:uncharacterized protein YndB with AHSA1/START domain